MIGVGGLGHVAVQLLRELSPARIVAVDLRERPRQLALDAGADVALDAEGRRAADVRASSAEAARRSCSTSSARTRRSRSPRRRSRVAATSAIVGLGGGTFPMAFGTLPLEWSAAQAELGHAPGAPRGRGARARRGDRHRRRALRLDDAIDGYRRLRNGEVVGRAVVVP